MSYFKKYPSKTLINDKFIYHTDGYLIRKSTGSPVGQMTKEKYPFTYFNGQYYKLSRLIFILNSDHETWEECVNNYINQCVKIAKIKYEKDSLHYIPEHIEPHLQPPTNPNYSYGISLNIDEYVCDHIDENIHNNRFQNLQILSRKENYEKITGKPYIYLSPHLIGSKRFKV